MYLKMVPVRVRLKETLRYRLFPLCLSFLEMIERTIAGQSIHPAKSSFTPANKSVLVLFHGMGGGADKQALADANALANNEYKVSLLTFQVMRRRFVLYPNGLHGEREYYYVPFELNALWKRMDELSFSEARLHHLRYWPQYVAQALPTYFTTRRILVTLNLHDFYYICPRIHLVNGNYDFCGIPDSSQCNACVKMSGHFVNMQGNVSAWRKQNLRLLQTAKNIIAPSQDAVNHYHKIFPELTITPLPWGDLAGSADLAYKSHATSVNIAVVGNLLRHKGADIVLAVAKYIKVHSLPLTLTVIGDSVYAQELAAQGVSVTGKYKQTDLAHLLVEHQTSYVWLASIWPETYCFALDEVWALGYPVVAFDLGAPAERIRLRKSAADIILSKELIHDTKALYSALAALSSSQESAPT